jgi:hypothetical protein
MWCICHFIDYFTVAAAISLVASSAVSSASGSHGYNKIYAHFVYCFSVVRKPVQAIEQV